MSPVSLSRASPFAAVVILALAPALGALVPVASAHTCSTTVANDADCDTSDCGNGDHWHEGPDRAACTGGEGNALGYCNYEGEAAGYQPNSIEWTLCYVKASLHGILESRGLWNGLFHKLDDLLPDLMFAHDP